MNSIPTLLFLTTITATAAPPTGAYLAWLQAKFSGQYGNAALEATVWGDHADPDGDGCPNIFEFMMAREPETWDAHLGLQSRIEGDDLIVTYRETTAANPGVNWQGEWSIDLDLWLAAGVRYETVSTHSGYRMVEARVSRNAEPRILLRLKAQR
jgi:hypothetical protein